MRILLDENLPSSTARLLRAIGHDIKDTKEERWFGFSDDRLFKIAKKQNRVLITLDKDFGNVLIFPPHQHHGIILLDFRNPTPKNVNGALESFLKNVTQSYLSRKLVLLNEWQARIRE